jgi:amino acid permease
MSRRTTDEVKYANADYRTLRSTHVSTVVEEPQSQGLIRALGLWDVTAITAGTILGSAIFVAAAFVPRAVPHPTLALLLWVAGGLIVIAGALTYAELGAMFPESGGQYSYIKQAFGPLWGFLFGWTSLLAIQAGANAYLGVAFGEYLGAFLPFFSSTHTIASIPIGPWMWEPNTAQLAGMTAIAGLTTVNYFGTKQGARVQGALTAIKLVSVAGLIDSDCSPRPTSPRTGPRRCRRATCSRPWASRSWWSSAAAMAGTKRRSALVRSNVPSAIFRSE